MDEKIHQLAYQVQQLQAATAALHLVLGKYFASLESEAEREQVKSLLQELKFKMMDKPPVPGTAIFIDELLQLMSGSYDHPD